MFWEWFEMQLMVAFSIIDKHEGRQVYSNVSKLRMLIKKIKAERLPRDCSEWDRTRHDEDSNDYDI